MQKSTKYNILAFLITTIAPIIYLLAIADVFKEGIFETETGFRSIMYVALGFFVVKTMQEFKKRANDPEGTNYRIRAMGSVIGDVMPWVIAVIIVSLVHLGIQNIYRHVLVFAGCQIVGGIFRYLEYYWRLEERKPLKKEAE